ncbi:MAG TPA: fluoride efflux transporter CrcB [Sphingobacterium bovisgrunnientis]|jgi:CrcB protein|uniref:fluoride efflux transporter CrcB n=1 Tax=Sphingobacterium bovisgrunnientis TaxID=1874697 RepID=UPI00135C7D30|nr:fluoride efflux transporter CrcB [Sphingobacterium bovisgrunnientis]HLS38419.1 fluoride efflux transporter CrcB [Sphingobacterium bovisgrunnientis]
MIKAIIMVGLGGALGSILRYLTAVLLNKHFQSAFPLATFAVNILGCLIIGVLLGLFERQYLTSPDFKLLLITGFCGGYTTFSAFSAENIQLLESGQTLTAFLYIGASIFIGLFALWLGLSIVKLS